MGPEEFVRAVRDRNEVLLATIPGISKKLAGRIVLELAEKIGRIMVSAGETASGEPPPTDADDQAMHALLALGLNQQEATKKLSKARMKLGIDAHVEHLIKEALHL
jgi:Holliday junction DNA helicase RuvA